jgi:3-dehydroquinate synthase
LPVTFSGHAPQRLWDLMQHDKKVQHGTLRFVLPDRLGHVELVPGVQQAMVMDVLARGCKPA